MWQLLAIGATLAVVAILLVPLKGPARWGIVAGVGLLPLLGLLVPGFSPPHDPGPAQAARDGYATSDRCRACHPAEWDSWRQTYHRTMTQRPTDEAVLPEWSGVLTHQGRTYRLFRKDEAFWVNMPAYGTTGAKVEDRRDRRVVLVTGSHKMQLYWIPVPWAGVPTDGPERSRFNKHCSACHGRDGSGGGKQVEVRRPRTVLGVVVHDPRQMVADPLADAELTPPELAESYAAPWHEALVPTLPASDEKAALAFAQRIQVRGALQQFPFAWWQVEERWMPEELTFLQPPESEHEVEHFEQSWSDACDQCHSVDPRATWRSDGAQLVGEVGELGIACEACHGPAEAHAARHANPVTRYSARLDNDVADDIINPSSLDHARGSAVCGQCHGELSHLDPEHGPFPVGERIEDWAHVLQLQPPPYPDWLQRELDDDPLLLDSAFWKDGTMRVAGRDLNALEASACFQRGEASCTSCHTLHGGTLDDNLAHGGRGDTACVECHPAVAAKGEAHTHHPPNSAGARCMNCHMPHTTLGLLGAIRSHRIDSPNATTAYTTGRPDACSLCHLDQPLDWTADALTRWYDQPPMRTAAGTESAAATEWYFRGDAVQRAVIAWHLGWKPAREASGADWQAAHLSYGLNDPYAAVRYMAGASLGRTPGYESVEYDFAAEPEARKAVARRVLDRWTDGKTHPRPTVLIGTDGLDVPMVETLQLLRDDRPVVVSE